MNRTKSAFLGAISSQIFTACALSLNLITTPFILGHLNSSVYGLSIIIFQITSYLGMFDFGLTAGVQRFLAGTRSDSDEAKAKIQKIISTSFIVYVILGLLVFLAGSLLAPFAAHVFHVPKNVLKDIQMIITVLSALVGCQFLLRAVSGIFFAHQKQLLSNTLSFVLNISNVLFTVLFVSLGYELWSFVFAQIMVFMVNAILTFSLFRKFYSYVKISVKDFEMSLLKEMLSYGFYLFIIGIAVQVVFQTDRILIGSIISLSAVSMYALTARLPEMASQFIWKVTDNSFPAMVELAKTDDRVQFREIHNKLMGLTLSLTTTAFWLLAYISGPFIKLWVGERLFAGQTFVFLICYLYLFQLTFIHVSSMCLNGAGIVKKLSFMSILESVLNLSFSIFLARRFGLIGVIMGTILSGMFTSFWYVPVLICRFMKVSYFKYAETLIKPVIICSIFDGLAYFIFHRYTNLITGWPRLIISAAIYSCFLALPMIWFNREFIKEARVKLLKKSKADAYT
jgi:O-antigen/teichoic acid export membrane protein